MSELSSTVAQDIMARIISDEFSAGLSFPNEANLCAHYGVSRVVIREAKKHLQALGMVQSRKKTGSFITPSINWNFFSQNLFDIYMRNSAQAHKHIEDYFALRLLIEPHLAAQVARNHSAEFVKTITAMLQELDAALESSDRDRWLRADIALHISLYQESQNLLVLPLANLMRPIFLHSSSAIWRGWPVCLLHHRRLAEAIFTHDADQAFHYAHLIVRNSHEDYLAYTGASPGDGL